MEAKPTEISGSKMFGGYNKRFKHFSPTLGCSMTFHVYFPPLPSPSHKFPGSWVASSPYKVLPSMFQGLGCSPIKALHELGSERCETVQSISGVSIRALTGPFPSTRGLGRMHLWCTSYHAHGKCWVAKCEVDNC
ncbi:S-formylglutathione hydrolase [Vitis vinifera]|uniref:S-formylglutathione hydrolase n=1 Tax=Vitis vinifera TaxID=29760 RepID=A0A438C074_VITVI|nr:S-formylglutathione hydrolase [Vitis vinifera]